MKRVFQLIKLELSLRKQIDLFTKTICSAGTKHTLFINRKVVQSDGE